MQKIDPKRHYFSSMYPTKCVSFVYICRKKDRIEGMNSLCFSIDLSKNKYKSYIYTIDRSIYHC